MAKKRTTPASYRSEFRHDLRVSSRRIVYCQAMRACKQTGRLVVILVLLGILAFMARRGWMHFVYHNEAFALQQVELPQRTSISTHRIIEAGDINLNASIFAIDTDELERKVTALPEVISAQAYVRFPGTLKVDIVERVPVAWVECRKLGVVGRDAVRGLLVDEEATLFSCDPEVFELMEHLPVIKLPALERDNLHPGGQLAQKQGLRAFSLLKEASEVALEMPGLPAFDSVTVRSENSLEAQFPDESTVIFGLYDHSRQLQDLATLRVRAAETNRYLANANLIPKRNIPVTLLPVE